MTVNHFTMNVLITPRVQCPASVPTFRNRIEKSERGMGQWGFRRDCSDGSVTNEPVQRAGSKSHSLSEVLAVNFLILRFPRQNVMKISALRVFRAVSAVHSDVSPLVAPLPLFPNIPPLRQILFPLSEWRYFPFY